MPKGRAKGRPTRGRGAAPCKSGRMPGTYEGRLFVGKFLHNEFEINSRLSYTHVLVLDLDTQSSQAVIEAREKLLSATPKIPVQVNSKKLSPVDNFMEIFHFSTKAPKGTEESDMEAKILFKKMQSCLTAALNGKPLTLDFGPPTLRLDRICNQDIRVVAKPSNEYLSFMDTFIVDYLKNYHNGSIFPSACKSEEILSCDKPENGTSQLYVLPCVPLLPCHGLSREAEGTLHEWLKSHTGTSSVGSLTFSGLRLISKIKEATMQPEAKKTPLPKSTQAPQQPQPARSSSNNSGSRNRSGTPPISGNPAPSFPSRGGHRGRGGGGRGRGRGRP